MAQVRVQTGELIRGNEDKRCPSPGVVADLGSKTVEGAIRTWADWGQGAGSGASISAERTAEAELAARRIEDLLAENPLTALPAEGPTALAPWYESA